MANEPALDFTLVGGRDSDTQFDPLPIAEPTAAPSATISIAPSAMRPEPTPQAHSTPVSSTDSSSRDGQDRYTKQEEPPTHSHEAMVSAFADAGNDFGFGETVMAVINLKTDVDRLSHFKSHLEGVGTRMLPPFKLVTYACVGSRLE
jgi:hypothetical protein